MFARASRMLSLLTKAPLLRPRHPSTLATLFQRFEKTAPLTSQPQRLFSSKKDAKKSKSKRKKSHIPNGPKPKEGEQEILDLKRSIQRKQLVLDNYSIPGKYQKYFTGRLRKRETKRLAKSLADDSSVKVRRVKSASTTTLDEHRLEMKRVQLSDYIVRALEEILASNQLPVRQLSLQHWRITGVVVSHSMKSVVCFYKVTSFCKEDGMTQRQMHTIIHESSQYLNLMINKQLAKASKGVYGSVNVRFRNGALTDNLLDRVLKQVEAAEAATATISESEEAVQADEPNEPDSSPVQEQSKIDQ